ncbi:MAG: FkbM family methyltransferase [Candidatus Saccharimonadales bacterium]
MNLEDYLKQPLEFEGIIDEYLDPGDAWVIFEIGACEGEDTIKLRRKYPNAQIYAFEPLPANIKKIRANYKKYGEHNINLFQLALSDKRAKAEFFVSSGHPVGIPNSKDWDYGNKSSSLLPPKDHKRIHPWVKFDKHAVVSTERLDNFCQAHSISKIDFIYLDVQGAEKMVLEGAGNYLNDVKLIWLEVEAIELYEGQPLKYDIEKFMTGKGFKRIKDTVGSIAGDQLYINRKLTKTRPLKRLKFWSS